MANTSKPVFNWASVAKGKPQTITQVEAEKAALKEKAEREKAERERLAWEAGAPLRARQEEKHLNDIKQAKEYAERQKIYQAEYDRKFRKEGGWLPGLWPTSYDVPNEPRLSVPTHVNERARDWTERALASWWQEWEKCNTVEALRMAFINAFVPFVFEDGTYSRGLDEFKHWERQKCEVKEGTSAERYSHLLKWVKAIEADKPYRNKLWVACKNITFENCLWAMNTEARTFRAIDKLCPDLVIPITGFLQVEGKLVTWLADFTKYIPYKHDPKPKSKQAIEAEAKRQRDEDEKLGRMMEDDDDY